MVVMRYHLSGKFVSKGSGVALSSLIILIALYSRRSRGIHTGYNGEFAPLFITQNVSQVQQVYIWYVSHVSVENVTRKVLVMVKPLKTKDWITL